MTMVKEIVMKKKNQDTILTQMTAIHTRLC